MEVYFTYILNFLCFISVLIISAILAAGIMCAIIKLAEHIVYVVENKLIEQRHVIEVNLWILYPTSIFLFTTEPYISYALIGLANSLIFFNNINNNNKGLTT